MSGDYNVPEAAATFVEPTGQMEYVLTWDRAYAQVWMSGTNLNTGTYWASTAPVEDSGRFGPLSTRSEFFAWVARFIRSMYSN